FGAAYRLPARNEETVSKNSQIGFTVAFAAPELARGEIPVPASDVFCLGATLHALVTGAPPREEVGQVEGTTVGTTAESTGRTGAARSVDGSENLGYTENLESTE